MMVAIVGDVLSVDLFEECCVLFNFGNLLFYGLFAADLFKLFGFEVVLPLELRDLGQLFVQVAHLLGQSPKEGFALLIYSLCFSLL